MRGVQALTFGDAGDYRYQLSFYTPTLVQNQLGYSLALANLVAVPISIVSGLALYVVTHHSDRSGQRHLSSMGCSLAAGLGFTMVLVGDTYKWPWVAYAGLMVAQSGAITNVPLTTVSVIFPPFLSPSHVLWHAGLAWDCDEVQRVLFDQCLGTFHTYRSCIFFSLAGLSLFTARICGCVAREMPCSPRLTPPLFHAHRTLTPAPNAGRRCGSQIP